jgi:hypothetical protein
MRVDVSLFDYLSGDGFEDAILAEMVVKSQYREMWTDGWNYDPSNKELENILLHHRYSDDSHAYIVKTPYLTAKIRNSRGSVSVSLFGNDVEAFNLYIEYLKEVFPPAQPSKGKTIPVYFWNNTSNGPKKTQRKIDVPSWDDIALNYSDSVQGALNQLMQGQNSTGKIILFSGSPGTGKSYAVRALAYEWRQQYVLHYVVDPEVFLGMSSEYLMEVVLSEEMDQRGHIFLLEDSGEMLTIDAKEHVGQALSRLLNLSDGILGQGLNFKFLITTNEEVGKLHPALVRSGRIVQNIVFGPLTTQGANEWLRQNDASIRVQHATTLAELYALLGGYGTEEAPKQVAGFLR